MRCLQNLIWAPLNRSSSNPKMVPTYTGFLHIQLVMLRAPKFRCCCASTEGRTDKTSIFSARSDNSLLPMVTPYWRSIIGGVQGEDEIFPVRYLPIGETMKFRTCSPEWITLSRWVSPIRIDWGLAVGATAVF